MASSRAALAQKVGKIRENFVENWGCRDRNVLPSCDPPHACVSRAVQRGLLPPHSNIRFSHGFDMISMVIRCALALRAIFPYFSGPAGLFPIIFGPCGAFPYNSGRRNEVTSTGRSFLGTTSALAEKKFFCRGFCGFLVHTISPHQLFLVRS